MTPAHVSKRQHTLLVLLAVVSVVAVLHFAEDVLIPVALSLLLAFLLAPMANRVERWGASRPVAVALTTVIAFALLGSLVYLVAHQFIGLVEDLPRYRDNLMVKVHSLAGGSASGGIERGVETVKELTDELQKSSPGTRDSPNITKVQVVEPPPNVALVVRGMFGPLIGPASTAAIVVVFVIFMLLQREDLRDRLVRLVGAQEMHTTLTALDDAAERVTRYLLAQTLINAVQGALVAIGLYFIGVPDALLWGGLTVVLRFIPYLGPALAAAGPIVLSLAFFGGWTEPLLVIALIVGLELISNNVFEPRMYGTSVGVSSFALIVAAVFWTWLWGTAGLFLATPLTVCLVVLGKYIPQLAFLEVMLGDQPALAPRERFYQRLLANDPEEALALLEEALQDAPLVEVCDTILLPAVRLVETDHERGAIDDARRSAILEQIGEMVEDLPSEASTPAPPFDAEGVPAVPRLSLLILPASDIADELAARILALLVPGASVDCQVMPAAALKSEMLDRVASSRPHAILVSATPPAAVIHARYLCKRLRGRFEGMPIVVGLWDAEGDLTKATERLEAVGAQTVVRRAQQALEEISRLHQPLLQGVKAESSGDAGLPAAAY